jgi:hypothetical protein
MMILAMIAFGWLALMVLVVSSCGAASLGDRSQEELPAPLSPHLKSHATRRRPRAPARAGDLQRRV